MTKLKLFVWTSHMTDWTEGLAFAIAPNEAEARKMIKGDGAEPSDWGDLAVYPLTKPIAFAVCGGG
jgi:hypothetical protein